MYAGTYYGQTYYGDTYPSYGTGGATYALTGALSGASSVTASDANAERLAAAIAGAGTEFGTMVPSGGLVFGSPCNTSADFTTVLAATGDTSVVGSAATGYIGSSIRQNMTIAASAETSVRKSLPSAVRISQFRYKADSAGTFSTTVDHNLHVLFSDSGFLNQIIHIRLIGVSGGYTLRVVDPNNSYATTVGTTVMSLATWHRFAVQITDTQIKVFLDNGVTPEIVYTPATGNYVNVYVNSLLWGRSFSQGYTGIQDVDEIWTGNIAAAPTTTAGQIADTYQGYLQRYLTFDGAIVRPPTEGSNGTFTTAVADVVSEGIAYGLKMAVQSNDQKTFNLVDNWTRANLDRRVSTTANTQLNAAPTTGLNLMAFHYNANSSDGKGAGTIYDANAALDADPERATALLWAHARWGSSSLTVGSGPELVTPNYMARALAITGDIATYGLKFSSATGFWYLVNDLQQTTDVVQLGPDYNNPAAFKMFAEYDVTNRAKWNLAVSGAYDILTKAANQVMTGATPAQSTTAALNPNWISFTLSTGLTSGTPSTYGDSNYGYNAFRSYNRLYDAYTWYGDTTALAALRLPKTFFTAQWNGSAKIAATYSHDGTNAATYEKTFFYWASYWSIYAGDTSNTVAAAIYSGKLASKYTQLPSGSYYDNGGYTYFDQSWNVINEMQKAGSFINYGQGTPIESTVLGTSTMTAAMQSASSYAVTGSLSGSGVETSSLSNAEVETGSLSGSAAVTSSMGDSELDSAAFSGTSAVTGSLANIELETASLSGVSSVAATISRSAPVTSALSGTSSTSSALSDTDPEAATISGAGIETSAISNTVLLSGALAGSSLFSSSFSGTQTLSATLSGSAAVVAAVGDASTVSSAEVGASSLTAILSDSEQFSAALSGTSTVTVSTSNQVATTATLLGGSQLGRQNLITNPSFETDTPGNLVNPAGWSLYGVNPTYKGVIAQNATYGANTFKVSAASITDCGIQYVVTGLTIGQTYTLSAYLKTDSTVVNANLILDTSQGIGGFMTRGSNSGANVNQRVSVTMTVDRTSCNVYMGQGSFGSNSFGNVWWDGVMLEVGSVAGTYIEGSQLSVSVSETQGGTLAGSSLVTSAIAIAGALGSSMVGASSLTATISDREVEAGTLSGSGTVAGLVTDTESVNASESGSSSVIGTVSDLENVTTALTGGSTLSATLATSGVFGATLVGSSVVGATIIDTETQSAPISGIASIIAALSDVEALSASLVGSSTVTASLSLLSTGVAAVAGASTTTVTFGADIDPTLAAVLGYGSLSATLSVTTPGRGSLLLLGIG